MKAAGFSTEDYQDALEQMRDLMATQNETGLRAFLSNNVNVLLGALNDAALYTA